MLAKKCFLLIIVFISQITILVYYAILYTILKYTVSSLCRKAKNRYPFG